jgi:hypothetical protein
MFNYMRRVNIELNYNRGEHGTKKKIEKYCVHLFPNGLSLTIVAIATDDRVGLPSQFASHPVRSHG